MYTYRHKKNGSIFSTPCVCTGEDYEEVKEVEVKESAPVKRGKKEETADSGGDDF